MSYLTLKANSSSIASTFTPAWMSIGAGGMQYRAVGATEWIDVARETTITVDTTGIELKADTIETGYAYHFAMTGSISASGDITSLTNGVGGDCTLQAYCYYYMFQGCEALTAAPTLPATAMAQACYEYMFASTSLTVAPALPATVLADYCYYYMFASCSLLTDAPVLPATTLFHHCYFYMFSRCTSLTVAPALPATTMASDCYCGMFSRCTALTVPPKLPATTLAHGCYENLFYTCTSLTAPPELPATTLAQACYKQMFYNCTSLIGYTTAEPGYTLIHNYPTCSEEEWNENMYYGINTASTIPETPSSNTNYYFKPASPPTPTPSITGKRLECFGHDPREIKS